MKLILRDKKEESLPEYVTDGKFHKKKRRN